MNKISKKAVFFLFSLTFLIPGFVSAEEMKTNVDYRQVEVMMKDGMELVPLRQVAESLGYQVMWNGDDRSVTLSYGGMTNKNMTDDSMTDDNMMDDHMTDDKMHSVKIKISSTQILVGMTEKMLSYAPVIIHDRTYVTKNFIDTYLSSQMMDK